MISHRERSSSRPLAKIAEVQVGGVTGRTRQGPRVAVVVDHPVIRSLVAELLARELGCVVIDDEDGRRTIADLARTDVEFLVVDGTVFAAACGDKSLPDEAPAVIVLGPEPDPGYRDYALARGASAWLAREQVGRELLAESRRVLHANPGHLIRGGAGNNGVLPDVRSGARVGRLGLRGRWCCHRR